jgi:hypothetical protein
MSFELSRPFFVRLFALREIDVYVTLRSATGGLARGLGGFASGRTQLLLAKSAC